MGMTLNRNEANHTTREVISKGGYLSSCNKELSKRRREYYLGTKPANVSQWLIGRELNCCGMDLDVTDEGRRCRTVLLISENVWSLLPDL